MSFIAIPFELLRREDLSASQKVLVGLIHSLSAKDGYCYASNQYLGEAIGVNAENVRKWIKGLEDKGIINRIVKRKYNGEIDSRELRLSIPMVLNDHTPLVKISHTPLVKNDHTSGKNLPHNKEDNKKEDNISIDRFEEFWNLYNKRVGKDKAKARWSKLKQKEVEAIFKSLPSYISDRPEVKFRKDPERYLSNRVWEDEIISNAKASIPLSANKITEITIPDNF
jgi:hypothetical protein